MKQLLIVAVCILQFWACEKEGTTCATKGQIIGFNAEKCLCCPGWTIVFGADTIKTMSFNNDSELYEISEIFGYPIDVKFDFKQTQSECPAYKDLTCYTIDYPNDCKSSGEIIGYDYTECYCCPGWIIASNNDTIKIGKLPQEELIWKKVENTGYPIQIQLDYEGMNDYCIGKYKKLLCFKLKE